ncbi:MAG: hypothetical protein QM711_14140 [Micropruina sp.]|uniref:hypothetical protein n=1 Tax=Micropruina sp. TaxID=2737536 RepID=UPI0039E3968C
MSALQIENRPSDAANESSSYGLADLRADVLADHGATVALRAAVGILVAVAVVILIAGVATQSVLAIIGGGFATVVTAAALVSLYGASVEPVRR